jgi:hypothetical protein
VRCRAGGWRKLGFRTAYRGGETKTCPRPPMPSGWMAGWMDVCHDWHSYAIIGLWSPWGLQVNERGHLTAVERVTIDLPPELKYWLDKQAQERKARGDRKASLRAVVVEMLEERTKTTSTCPMLDQAAVKEWDGVSAHLAQCDGGGVLCRPCRDEPQYHGLTAGGVRMAELQADGPPASRMPRPSRNPPMTWPDGTALAASSPPAYTARPSASTTRPAAKALAA